MSAPWTPGPWSFDGEPDNHIVWSSSENRVCFMTSTGPTTANARLIAAAPDMFEALEPLALLSGDGAGGVNMHDPLSKWFTVGQLRAAAEAIRKARGDTQSTGVVG